MKALLQDREEGGYLLSKKLGAYHETNAVVVGIPHGGVCVASVIAEQLSLPLEVMPCRKIKHPADGKIYIGSVSEDDVFIHDYSHSIPQDYIYHQIALARNAILREKRNYQRLHNKPLVFEYRTVILVDDILASSDTMMACLRSIRKQHPLKIVVAVPVVSADAVRIINAQADEMQFLKMEPSLEAAHEYFTDFPRVNEHMVKELLETSRKKGAKGK